MTPIIRKAKKSDFEKIKHFIREHWENNRPELRYESIQKNTEASYKTHVGKDGTFVLELDGKIIGYVSVGVRKNKELNLIEGELYMIHIEKGFRGKGYSNLLMRTADEYFKKKKPDYCIVTTNLNNEIAQSLYKKYGFLPWRLTLKRLSKAN